MDKPLLWTVLSTLVTGLFMLELVLTQMKFKFAKIIKSKTEFFVQKLHYKNLQSSDTSVDKFKQQGNISFGK